MVTVAESPVDTVGAYSTSSVLEPPSGGTVNAPVLLREKAPEPVTEMVSTSRSARPTFTISTAWKGATVPASTAPKSSAVDDKSMSGSGMSMARAAMGMTFSGSSGSSLTISRSRPMSPTEDGIRVRPTSVESPGSMVISPSSRE